MSDGSGTGAPGESPRAPAPTASTTPRIRSSRRRASSSSESMVTLKAAKGSETQLGEGWVRVIRCGPCTGPSTVHPRAPHHPMWRFRVDCLGSYPPLVSGTTPPRRAAIPPSPPRPPAPLTPPPRPPAPLTPLKTPLCLPSPKPLPLPLLSGGDACEGRGGVVNGLRRGALPPLPPPSNLVDV